MYYYIAQGIGFIGLGLAIVSFQQNTHKGILFFQMLASVVFCLHFFLLNAYVGAAMNFIGIFRAYIFSNRHKAWASSRIWIAVFIIAYVTAGILSWQNIYSLFPIIAMVLSTISFWIKNPKYVRIITLPGSPCWFIYNMVNNSFPTMITEIFISASILIGMFRFDIKKKKAAI